MSDEIMKHLPEAKDLIRQRLQEGSVAPLELFADADGANGTIYRDTLRYAGNDLLSSQQIEFAPQRRLKLSDKDERTE